MSEAAVRRIRRAARVIVLDPAGRVLLFRYVAPDYDPFWILPGGACELDEGFAEAAARELREETGIAALPGPTGDVKDAKYIYLGEPVHSIEHFFWLRVADNTVDTSGHTELEREVMQVHRWFDRSEIPDWPETIYPLDLAQLIGRLVCR